MKTHEQKKLSVLLSRDFHRKMVVSGRDREEGSARPDQSRVAACASISPGASVGMQRVSSLRTRRVAASNTEREARKTRA